MEYYNSSNDLPPSRSPAQQKAVLRVSIRLGKEHHCVEFFVHFFIDMSTYPEREVPEVRIHRKGDLRRDHHYRMIASAGWRREVAKYLQEGARAAGCIGRAMVFDIVEECRALLVRDLSAFSNLGLLAPLPPILVMTILSFLPGREICAKMRTCRTWYRLSLNDVLWLYVCKKQGILDVARRRKKVRKIPRRKLSTGNLSSQLGKEAAAGGGEGNEASRFILFSEKREQNRIYVVDRKRLEYWIPPPPNMSSSQEREHSQYRPQQQQQQQQKKPSLWKLMHELQTDIDRLEKDLYLVESPKNYADSISRSESKKKAKKNTKLAKLYIKCYAMNYLRKGIEYVVASSSAPVQKNSGGGCGGCGCNAREQDRVVSHFRRFYQVLSKRWHFPERRRAVIYNGGKAMPEIEEEEEEEELMGDEEEGEEVACVLYDNNEDDDGDAGDNRKESWRWSAASKNINTKKKNKKEREGEDYSTFSRIFGGEPYRNSSSSSRNKNKNINKNNNSNNNNNNNEDDELSQFDNTDYYCSSNDDYYYNITNEIEDDKFIFDFLL